MVLLSLLFAANFTGRSDDSEAIIVGPLDISTNATLGGDFPMPSEPISALSYPEATLPSSSILTGLVHSATGNIVPPDTHGAAGPNHLVSLLNTEFQVLNRSGVLLTNKTLTQFWTATNVGAFTRVFDPQIFYDKHHDRWIATSAVDSRGTNSGVLVGTSMSGDPLGPWNLRRMHADSNNVVWADRPNLGFNRNWIVIQANMFLTNSSTFRHSHFFVLGKTNFYASNFTYRVLVHTNWASSEVPAVTDDPNENALHILQNVNGNVRVTNETSTNIFAYIRLLSITGAIGSEALAFSTNASYFVVTNDWSWAHTPASREFAPQTNLTRRLDLNDSRLMNVLYKNGFLWATHHVFLPADNPTRTAIQWWRFNPQTTQIMSRGRVQDTTGAQFHGYPSLAVNRFNDFVIGYTMFTSNSWPSAATYYSTPYRFTDTSTNIVYKAGEGRYFNLGNISATVNRWGDYSVTVTDPLNDTEFWTLQEYARVPNGIGDQNLDGRWGTAWGNIRPEISSNDAFVNAIEMTGSVATTTNRFVRATRETNEVTHLTNSAYMSVWYKWTSPGTGNTFVELTERTFPAGIVVYTGTNVTSLTRISDSISFRPINDFHPIAGFQPTSGTTYYFALVGTTNTFGRYVLKVRQPPLPEVVQDPLPKDPHVIDCYPITFTAMAAGSPGPSIQWQYSTDTNTWSDISGATTTNYLITSVSATLSNRLYRIKASNSNGTAYSGYTQLKYFPAASEPLQNMYVTNSNAFYLELNEVEGYWYVIEVATNITSPMVWAPIHTNQVPIHYTDTAYTNCPVRFYRSRFLY